MDLNRLNDFRVHHWIHRARPSPPVHINIMCRIPRRLVRRVTRKREAESGGIVAIRLWVSGIIRGG